MHKYTLGMAFKMTLQDCSVQESVLYCTELNMQLADDTFSISEVMIVNFTCISQLTCILSVHKGK